MSQEIQSAAPINKDLRSCLFGFLFTLALYLLPLLALAIGWIWWDFKTGALAALISFVTLASLAAGGLILVRNPSAMTASLPLIFGVCYAVLPDFIIGTIDDGIAFLFGALLSFLMWRRRRPGFPIWTLLPLMIAGFYTLIGGFILPFLGPLDEIAAYLIISGLSWVYWQNKPRPVSESAVSHEMSSSESLLP